MFCLAAFPQLITQFHGALAASFTLVFVHSILNIVWFSAMIVLFSRLAKAAPGNHETLDRKTCRSSLPVQQSRAVRIGNSTIVLIFEWAIDAQ